MDQDHQSDSGSDSEVQEIDQVPDVEAEESSQNHQQRQPQHSSEEEEESEEHSECAEAEAAEGEGEEDNSEGFDTEGSRLHPGASEEQEEAAQEEPGIPRGSSGMAGDDPVNTGSQEAASANANPSPSVPVNALNGKSAGREFRKILVTPVGTGKGHWPDVLEDAKKGQFSNRDSMKEPDFEKACKRALLNVKDTVPPKKTWGNCKKFQKDLKAQAMTVKEELGVEMAEELVGVPASLSQAVAVFHIEDGKEFPQGKGWANMIASMCGKHGGWCQL